MLIKVVSGSIVTDFEPNKKSCKEIPVIQWLSISYHMETLNLISS